MTEMSKGKRPYKKYYEVCFDRSTTIEMLEHLHDVSKGDNKDAIAEHQDKQEEISQLRIKGAIKQFPMKPICDTHYYCPSCRCKIGKSVCGVKMNYCLSCGQKLDWSDM